MKKTLKLILAIILPFFVFEVYYYSIEGGNIVFFIQDERVFSDSSETVIIEYEGKYEEFVLDREQLVIGGHAYDNFSFDVMKVHRDSLKSSVSKTYPIVQWIVINVYNDSTIVTSNFTPILLQ
ncbi:MAG: hypothetical protein H6566_08815 [Lewinellaceae bacterium]|nr:hypothetical protein [Lewinellaceae bacterium]